MFFSEISYFSGFYLTNKYLENYFNKKNARNFVAGIHALSSVILNSGFLVTNNLILDKVSLNLSIGYFIYDSYYIIRFDKRNFLNYCYLYHHFASLYLIYNHNNLYCIHQILLLGELSNLPSYVIYHFLHLDKITLEIQNKITLFKRIQKVLYTLIRIPVMSYVLKNLIFTLDMKNPKILSICGIALPVYVMGLFWSAKIILDK